MSWTDGLDEVTRARLLKAIPELRGPMRPLPEPRIDVDLNDLTADQLAEMDRVIEQINRDFP